MGNYFWFYSTVAQVFAALWAVTGMFAVFRLELLDRKIEDALLSLLYFIFGESITNELAMELSNIRDRIINEIEKDNEKNYFKMSPERLVVKRREAEYVIEKFAASLKQLKKELENQKEQHARGSEVSLPTLDAQPLRQKIIEKFQELNDVYGSECYYKKHLIKNLTRVTILDGLIIGVSLLVLFYLSKALPLKVFMDWIEIFVLLVSLFAIGLSARFIWRYCRRR